MKISVIIPSYKPKDYIFKCLDSIVNQDLSNTEYEIVLVLNGCNEPYKSQLSNYFESLASKPKVNLIQTDDPGVSNARNIALNSAVGDYIAFVDDDDWLSSNYLSSLYSIADETTLSVSNVIEYDESTCKYEENFLTKAYKETKNIKDLSLYKGRRHLSAVWAKLISRRMIGSKRFDVNYALGEDSLFITSLSKNIHNIRLAQEDVVYYVNRRPNSVSRRNVSTLLQIKNSLSLAWRYTLMYLSDVRHNDFKFYGSRVFASLRKAISKKYRTT